MTTSTTLSARPAVTSGPDPALLQEFIASLKRTAKFDGVISHAQGTSSRIALYYHASYLEFFARSAPYGPIPQEAAQRIAAILGEDLRLPLRYPRNRRTFFNHAEKARRVLGWRKLEGKSRRPIHSWLVLQAQRTDDPDYLQQQLVARLGTSRIVLPSDWTLNQMIARARTQAQESICESITRPLNNNHKRRIDQLRKLKPGTHRTWLQWIKNPAGFASPRVLCEVLDRIEHIRSVGIPLPAVEAIHPEMRRRMAATVDVYSVDNLYSDFLSSGTEPTSLATCTNA